MTNLAFKSFFLLQFCPVLEVKFGFLKTEIVPRRYVVKPTGKESSSAPNKESRKLSKKAGLNNPWALASEGTQLAVTMLVFFFLGFYLDRRFDWTPWGTLVGSVLGIVIGLYSFLIRFLK